MILTACGNDKGITSNQKGSYKEDKFSETNQKVEAKVIDSKYYRWTDESVDTETITVYAEVKNTGDTDIRPGDAKLTFLDTNGRVISSTSDERISPSFLKKGATGYISAEIEGDVEKYKDLDEVDFELSPEPFKEGIVEFDSEDTNLNIEVWGETNASISMTGFLINDSDIDFNNDETSATLGFYDKDNNFLASQSMFSGQNFKLDAKGKTSFDIAGGSPLPPEVGKKVDHAEVKAIGVENMDEIY